MRQAYVLKTSLIIGGGNVGMMSTTNVAIQPEFREGAYGAPMLNQLAQESLVAVN